jgi:3-phenylpropionate/trans-cinnamate dioxygenase ferredoxin reductase component
MEMTSSSRDRIVVIGGGLAGAKGVEGLRAAGYDGALTLVGAESHLPYERPPMSKGYLMGETSFDEAVVHPQEWYDDNHVELLLGATAGPIDAAEHVVTMRNGDQLRYDRLMLATGAAPRRLPVPGNTAAGVYYLRTRDDADQIRQAFGPGKSLVVIGAGWIGMEVAAAARSKGTEVTVVDTAALPLLAVLGEQMGEVFAGLHREHGVDLRMHTGITEITEHSGSVSGVSFDDGSNVAAEAVVIGIGVQPVVDLAVGARLELDNGVLVDPSLRSSDPDIWAVGDIANHDHPVLGTRIRVEHWATALNQPAVAARAMLGGGDVYDELPYFFSDQYDLGMEYIGRHRPLSRVVVRGDLGAREFVAFWLDAEDRIEASMNVNVWDVVDEVKPLIRDRVRVDPVRLGDASVPYRDLAG